MNIGYTTWGGLGGEKNPNTKKQKQTKPPKKKERGERR